jgi:hypothetical protein
MSNSTRYSGAVTSSHTSGSATLPAGVAQGDFRIGNIDDTDISEYEFSFEHPVDISLSQAEFQFALFDFYETWTISTVGGPIDVENPVVNLTTNNATVWNDNELQNVVGNGTNTVAFSPKYSTGDGFAPASDSQWRVSAENITSMRISYENSLATPNNTNINIQADCLVSDTDNDNTPDYLDPDSDNDGLNDGLEDTNANGVVDPGETDPTNPDTDGDTLLDGQEDANSNGSVDIGETSPLTSDTDGDGDSDNTDICPLDPDNNCDGDNIPTSIEDAGPNNGDSDNDGVLDSAQANVAASPNPNAPSHTSSSPAYTSMVLNTSNSTCDTIDTLGFTTESNLVTQDESYDYPIGLFDFEISCSDAGDTAYITYILDSEYDTSDWLWRKYQPNTDTYSDISSRVTFGTIQIDGTNKTTATLQVTDGTTLDDDGLTNATILDPSGPAIQVESLEDTGFPAYYFIALGSTIIPVAVVVKDLTRKRRFVL